MTDDELKALFAANTEAFSRLEKRIDDSAAETRRYVDDSAAETRRHVDDSAIETRRHFDVTAEGVEKRFDLLAEAVQHTQAMIKFSHAELDRRFRTLEDSVSDLQARVERLETSTH